MADTPIKFSLKLDSPKISSQKFLRAAKAFFGFLDEMTGSLYESKRAISWSVEVRPGCAEITAVPDSQEKARTMKKVVDEGLKSLRSRRERPKSFSDEALEEIKKLAELEGDDGLVVSLGGGKKRQIITMEVARNIDQLMAGRYSSIGTIEGHLQILAKRQNEFQIEIKETGTRRLIKCQLPPEMLEDAKGAFNRRVSVTGTIRYKANGDPNRIEVEKIYRFPWQRELPHHDDIRGIYGGVS